MSRPDPCTGARRNSTCELLVVIRTSFLLFVCSLDETHSDSEITQSFDSPLPSTRPRTTSCPTPTAPSVQQCDKKRHMFLSMQSSSGSGCSSPSLSTLANRNSARLSTYASTKSSVGGGGDESDCSVHSDMSSMLDVFVEDDDPHLTATRLEHLERILTRVNARLEKDEEERQALPFIEESPGPIRLPSIKWESRRWRHLSEQLHLPASLVVSMARSIVRSDFFESEQ